MIKEYIDYLKNNPEGYWFKAKLYGWGWTPAKWQGWIVVIVYIALILTLVLTRENDIPGNPDSVSNFLTFAFPIIVLTALLVFIAYKNGEKPRFQWGLPKEHDKSSEQGK